MLEIASRHFAKQFQEKEVDDAKGIFFLNSLEKRVPTEVKEDLESEVNLAELLLALGGMKDNKAPGIDGLTKEFYCTFWDVFACHYLEVVKEMFISGRMGPTMREGVISLLYKKGDPKMLCNYRPLTLLCVDYKILSKVITNRMASAMPFIVNKDQTCGVKGRRIHWNMHLHRDLLMYLEDRCMSAIIVNLDNEKAFDRVHHKYLFKILQEFGFGTNLLK